MVMSIIGVDKVKAILYNKCMRKKQANQRVQIYLTTKQVAGFDKAADEMGINRSELIRRVLDKWLEEQKNG